MSKYLLFCDGSVHPQSKIGFAAYLLILEEELLFTNLQTKIRIKKITNTSSTKLEVETLLWALKDINIKDNSLTVYTDCQNILGLKDRREGFEKSEYITKKGTLIANHELYKEFYALTDKLNSDIIKVKGHKKNSLKNDIDNVFTLVDKASRNALREHLS